MIKSLAALSVLLLAVAGCGGSSSADDTKAAKALSATMLSTAEESSLDITQEQADCVGEGLVDEFGADELVDLGILKDDFTTNESSDFAELSSDDGERAATVFLDCVDMVALLKDELANDPTVASLPENVRTCIESELTDEIARALILDTFRGTTSGQEELQSKLMACAFGS